MSMPSASSPSLLLRLAVTAGSLLVALELAYRWKSELRVEPVRPIGWQVIEPAVARYLPVRTWVLGHRGDVGALGLVAATAVALAYRSALLLWHNQIVPRLSGTYFHEDDHRFPAREVDVLAEIARRPPGLTFVGLSPRRSTLGWRWRPVYVDERQRTTHRHVLGKTGSGKTHGVLWPQVLQDALAGKGCVVISGKGSDEEIGTIKAIARLAGRERDLRVFALPAWNQPAIQSHTYNMVWVEPRTPDGPGGDPVVVAERVFSVLPLGDNRYYNVQAQLMFTNLCRLLHGMVDAKGFGVPFTMRDVAACLKGVGARDATWKAALDHCKAQSLDHEAMR